MLRFPRNSQDLRGFAWHYLSSETYVWPFNFYFAKKGPKFNEVVYVSWTIIKFVKNPIE